MESWPVESASGAQGHFPFKKFFSRLEAIHLKIPLTFIRIDGDLNHTMITRYRNKKIHE